MFEELQSCTKNFEHVQTTAKLCEGPQSSSKLCDGTRKIRKNEGSAKKLVRFGRFDLSY